MSNEKPGKEEKEDKSNKIITLNKELINRIKYCKKRIESHKSKLTRDMTPLIRELEDVNEELEDFKFDMQEKYLQPLEKIILNSDDLKASLEIGSRVRELRKKVRLVDRRSPSSLEIEKYKYLQELYEDQVCSEAGVLPDVVKWDTGVAEVPHDYIHLNEVEKSVMSDMEAHSEELNKLFIKKENSATKDNEGDTENVT